MKKHLLIIFLTIYFISDCYSAKIFNHLIEIDYSSTQISVEESETGKQYSVVRNPELENVSDSQSYDIPSKIIIFEVPIFSRNHKVELASYSLHDQIQLQYDINSRDIRPADMDPAYKDNTDSNEVLLYHDAPNAEIVDEYIIDNSRHFVVVELKPIVYEPGTRMLKFYNECNLNFSYEEGKSNDANFESIQTTGCLNGHKFSDQRIIKLCQANPVSPETDVEEVISHYVIIIPEDLKPGIENFCFWKRQKGYNVKTITVEEILSDPSYSIGANSKCFDKEACVREWMRDYYGDNGAFFCLIVGDYRTSAPIRKFRCSFQVDKKVIPDWTNPNIDEYVPTDAYYSDLVSNWNFELCPANIYVSNLKDATFSPTIPVGRLLCWDITQIENFTQKVILYELNPGKGDPSYLLNGLLARHQHFKGYTNIFSYSEDFNVNILDSNEAPLVADLRPTGKEVISNMRNAGLYSLQGHGSPIGISFAEVNGDVSQWPENRNILSQSEYKNFYTRYNADEDNGLDFLNNEDKPAIGYSWACTISPYDYKFDFPEIQYNVGAAFTVAGLYGGPALISNTRVGYFMVSNRLEDYFARHLNSYMPIGIIENLSRIEYTGNFEVARFVKFCNNVIGDSEIKIWVNAPTLLPAKIKFSNGSLSISNIQATHLTYGLKDTEYRRFESINVPEEITIELGQPKDNYSLVYIETDAHFPETIFVANGLPITTNVGTLFLNNAKFSNSAVPTGKYVSLSNYSYPLRIGENGAINFHVYNDVVSESGITIENKGSLVLNCEKNVKLSGDKVEKDGELHICSESLTLGSGFEVRKGAKFEFKTENSK